MQMTLICIAKPRSVCACVSFEWACQETSAFLREDVFVLRLCGHLFLALAHAHTQMQLVQTGSKERKHTQAPIATTSPSGKAAVRGCKPQTGCLFGRVIGASEVRPSMRTHTHTY